MIDIKQNLQNNSCKKILFMGTPDIADFHLKSLIENKENIIGVVTQPDRAVGRKQVLTPPSVKVLAQEHNLDVYQPQAKQEILDVVKQLNPDLVIVVAYGNLLLPELVDNWLCINVHVSLLPKYRGASPIQAAILNGDKQTGVSIMVMDHGLDTGPVISVRKFPVLNGETSGQLFERMSDEAPAALIDCLATLREQKENIEVTQQDESLVSHTKKLKKQDGLIDPSWDVLKKYNHIKGMNPWPGAFIEVNDKMIKVFDAEIIDGKLIPLEVQPAGKKRMPYSDFLKGHESLII